MKIWFVFLLEICYQKKLQKNQITENKFMNAGKNMATFQMKLL